MTAPAPTSHDCFFAHIEPNMLVCETCPKLAPDKEFPLGCTKNKNFPQHDCYYPEKMNCKMCFHRFYCTYKVVLSKPLPYKYFIKDGKLHTRKVKPHGKV